MIVNLYSGGLQCCKLGKKPHFMLQIITLLSVAVRSCFSAFRPPLPSICFLLGAFEEAAGLPCKMPVLPPCPVFPFPSLCTAQRHAGLSCVASQMLVYLGRQAEAAVGATGGKGTLRQAEVGRPTVRLGAAETNQTGVLTL